MKLIRKKWPIRKSVFFILCCCYILLALLVYIPGHKIYQNLFYVDDGNASGSVPLLLVVPLFCLVVTGFFFFYYVTKMISESRTFHSRFRFFLSFASICFLIMLPTIGIMPSLIFPCVDALENQDIPDAVETGFSVADAYYRNRLDTVHHAVDSYLTLLNIGRDTADSAWIWARLQEIDSGASSLQIFSIIRTGDVPEVKLLSANGDSSCFVSAQDVIMLRDGFSHPDVFSRLNLPVVQDRITYVKSLRMGTQAKVCVYTGVLYDGFDRALQTFLVAKDRTDYIQYYNGSLKRKILFCTLLLLLPSLLLLPVIFYIISCRLVAPLEIMAESVLRRNSGSYSLQILPDPSCCEEKIVGTYINHSGLESKDS